MPCRAEGIHVSKTYAMWMKLPEEDLKSRARDFLTNKQQPDSAMMCYTIILNRYKDKDINKSNAAEYADIIYDVGYMYYFYYFDYEKS